MNAIRPKEVKKGKQFDEHAKRYVFFPLNDLNLSGSQAMNPVWCPMIPMGRFVLLESLEYMTQVIDEEQAHGGNGIKLGQRTMGTSQQVHFLMGSTNGAGYMELGMTYLEPLTNVDPKTASEIEEFLLPKTENGDIYVPNDLYKFKEALLSVEIPESETLTENVRQFMVDGINRAISFCLNHCSVLEKELQDGLAGKMGIKSLSENHKFYFRKINRPLPEDRAGVNMGSELAKVLAPIIQSAGGLGVSPARENSELKDAIELQELKKQLAVANSQVDKLEKENKELAKVIENV